MRKVGRITGICVLSFVAALMIAVVIVATQWSLAYHAIDRLTRTTFGWDAETYAEGTEIFYKTRAGSFAEAREQSKAVALDAQAEGSVLLENDGALPLAPTERRVSVFGSASVNIAHGGTGSGEGNQSANVGLYDALNGAGFEVNPELRSFYERKKKDGYKRGRGTDMNGAYYGRRGGRDYGYSINEVERAAYTDVRSSYADYADAAIVVIGRSGGEGQDLPASMAEFYEADEKSYLELTDEELGLLEEVSAGGFGKVIVLVNAFNAMDLSPIADGGLGVNAALWIGGTGNYGLCAVADVLKGDREPAGRLADTFAAPLSSPSMQNFGDNRFTEAGEITTAAYVAYAESVYVGYRYYETRYADVVTDRAGAGDFDYSSEVTYPFGYGLSYTSFKWTGFGMTADADSITVTVTVTNTGERRGKDVVQIYAGKPYTAYDEANRLEKSAVDLMAFVKTTELDPGESREFSASFPISELASYDTYGYGTYLIEPEDYVVTAARNAHDAVNNILTRGGYDVSDGATEAGDAAFTDVYRPDAFTLCDVSGSGYAIENRFETESYTSVPDDLGFLTRRDWTGSWPEVYGDKGSVAGKATMEFDPKTKAEILSVDGVGANNDLEDYVYDAAAGELRTVAIGKAVTDSGDGLNFADMFDESGKALPYGDEKWQRLVECMSADELYRLCSYGLGEISAVKSINKLGSLTSDSPMGLHCGTLFPCYPIQAATWNTEIAARIGDALAEEALWNNIRGWYAPACNTHRNPFGGRNYEYYSEDGCLAGVYAASVVTAAQSRGLFVHLKHFALNDQDTNRGDRGNYKNDDPYNGLCTYATEQTIREIYLKTFRYAVERGGAHGVMTSYNRIGNVWSGGHYGLMTEVLRNEWGMQGVALTDYAGTWGYRYMDMDQGLRAGNDQWLHPQDGFPITDRSSDAAIYYLQKSAKNILFAEACSSRVNGHRFGSGDSITVNYAMPLWVALLITATVIVCLVCAVGIVLIARRLRSA